MKDTLDLIEAHLRGLVEKTMLLLPGGDQQNRLVQQLVDALKTLLYNHSMGDSDLPLSLVIYLNPEDLAVWQINPALTDTLANSVSHVASEAGVKLKANPVIRLAADADLRVGILHVEGGTPQTHTRQTAILTPLERQQGPVLPRKAFLIINGETVYPIEGKVINIGRRSDNHLVLDDSRISRLHAQIRSVQNSHIIFDLNSTGGTYVNGKRITQYTLRSGDVISIAGIPLVFGEDISSLASDAEETASFPKLPYHQKQQKNS